MFFIWDFLEVLLKNTLKNIRHLQSLKAENEAELNANTDIEEPDENAHKMNKEDY